MNRESKQAQALLRVFESLGVPLIGAVDELLAWQGAAADPSPEDAARRFSALLSSAITAGTQLSGRLGAATQEEAEAVRLRTATLAGAVIAQHYVVSGAMPDEAFNRRLTLAFDSLLSLADSFPVLPDESMSETELVAARVEALTPFAAAVMRFPFGQEDSAVIRKMGEQLCDRATALADAFSGGASDGPEVYAQRELAFLKGGAKLLARACEIEMDQMQHAIAQNKMSEPPAPDEIMDRIWQRFEDGLDVLRAVIGFMSVPAQSSAAPAGPRISEAQPQTQAAPQAQAQSQAQAKPAGIPGNPMSFFVKKTDETSTSGEAA